MRRVCEEAGHKNMQKNTKGARRMSEVEEELYNTGSTIGYLEQLEKENAKLKNLIFKSWMSQTERYNPDLSQDIDTQWMSSSFYKLLKEQGE